MKQFPKSNVHSQRGAVLLESMVALLLFSLGVLALMGLQASMLRNVDDAKYRAEASFVAQQKISEIWLTGANANLADFIETDTATAQLPNGKTSVAVNANREIQVTVQWTMPSGSEHTYLAKARVEGVK